MSDISRDELARFGGWMDLGMKERVSVKRQWSLSMDNWNNTSSLTEK